MEDGNGICRSTRLRYRWCVCCALLALATVCYSVLWEVLRLDDNDLSASLWLGFCLLAGPSAFFTSVGMFCYGACLVMQWILIYFVGMAVLRRSASHPWLMMTVSACCLAVYIACGWLTWALSMASAAG